jgi:hypothetical protein
LVRTARFPLGRWTDPKPTSYDFIVTHRVDLIGPVAEDEVVMVGENRVAEDIDRKAIGQESQSLIEPATAMGEIRSGYWIDPTEKASPDDSVVAVVDTHNLGIKDFASFYSDHSLPHC